VRRHCAARADAEHAHGQPVAKAPCQALIGQERQQQRTGRLFTGYRVQEQLATRHVLFSYHEG
jgi:hypothetical protein